jgi:hypothetical protein
MTVQLSEALRELADDRPPGATSTRDADAARGAWRRSRQVRRRRRVAGAAVAVVAALLVVPVVSSLSGLQADPPLPGEVPGVAGVPDRLYEPPDLVPSVTGGPGTPAAVSVVSRLPQRIAGWNADGSGEQGQAAVLVSATSDVYSAFAGVADFVALSRDGRRAAVVSPMATTIGSILTIVDLVSGQAQVTTYPDWTINGVVFSPDGTQLAISAGLRMTGSDSATLGHVYVRFADGTTQDLGESGAAFGWLPDGSEVVMSEVGSLRRDDVTAVSVVAGRTPSSRPFGPYVDVWAQDGASALSPDGRLVAVAGLNGNLANTLSPFTLTVTRLSDAKVIQTVELPAVYNAQFVGWRDATTPVLAVWSPDTADGFVLVAETTDGPVTLSSGPAEAGSQQAAAAQDLLATVRPSGPPVAIPWYRDWYAATWHVSAWFGMTPSGLRTLLLVLGLIAVPIVLVLLNNRRVKRRDPEAYIS